MTCLCRHDRRQKYISTKSQKEVLGLRQALTALSPIETDIHCTGGWVGFVAVRTAWKTTLLPGFDSRTVQPLASHHTD
jgi:hypothetical protein